MGLPQWVRLQLSEGVYRSERLLSSGLVQEMHTPQTIIRPEPPFSLMSPGAHFRAYGIGWFLHDYHGRKLVHHGGNIDGMSALVTMIPEEELGLIILTNMNGTVLPYALMYRVFDAYLGLPEHDWSSEVLEMMKGAQKQGKAAMKKMEEARVKGTTPSLPPAKYIGTYENELYGKGRIAHEDGTLVLHFNPALTGDLEHWHYDTFHLTWHDPVVESVAGKPFVTFVLNMEAEVAEMKIQNVADFKRVPKLAEAVPAMDISEEELRKFLGEFVSQTPPLEASIELVAGQLKAVLPGQLVYTLVPVAPTRFRIEGLPEGFFVQYEMADGKVKSATLEQGPGPSVTLLPKE